MFGAIITVVVMFGAIITVVAMFGAIIAVVVIVVFGCVFSVVTVD
ncbi:unnamed protein product, partial [Rotaria sp. Silwood2]